MELELNYILFSFCLSFLFTYSYEKYKEYVKQRQYQTFYNNFITLYTCFMTTFNFISFSHYIENRYNRTNYSFSQVIETLSNISDDLKNIKTNINEHTRTEDTRTEDVRENRRGLEDN